VLSRFARLWLGVTFAARRVDVCQRLSSGTMPASVGDSGLRGSNRTLPEYSPHAMRAVM